MSSDKIEPRKTSTFADTLLLVLVCVTIFLVPLFPTALHLRIYDALFTGIFLTSAFSLQKNRRFILTAAVIITGIQWAGFHFGLSIANVVSRALAILFFVWIVISLVIQIARTRNVTSNVIIDAINGYLLLGLLFTLMVGLAIRYQPQAFSFPDSSTASIHQTESLSDYFYFTFVTFATLGYGDVLPKTPGAKSLAIFIAVVGQLYLATIIAMLVGKYVASATVENDRFDG